MSKAYFYDAEGHDREVDLTAARLSEVGENQLLWIDLLRSDESAVNKSASLLALPAESLALTLTPPNPPQPDNFGEHFQFSLPLPPKQGRASTGRLDFLVGEKWLVTVRDDEVEFLARFRDQDKAETLTGRLIPAALAASLLDWHLETYHVEIAHVEEAVDRLDEAVLAAREKRPPLSTLAAMRRRVSQLRAAVNLHRPIIHGLLRPDFAAVSETSAAENYRSLERRFERTEDRVESARDLVGTSFELYATRTAQDTNQLVKMLTLVTVVIGFVGAIAGVFGMNFDTPFSHTGFLGFSEVTFGMILASTGIVALALLRKWI